jgi:membrane protease YdiL (CAAX protease family)
MHPEPPRAPRPPEPPGSPPASPPPGGWLRLALAFYAGLLGLALLWDRLAGEPLLHASRAAALRGVDPWRDPAAGALAGALAVLASRALARQTAWGGRAARALGALLGPLPTAHCLALALASGVAEEAFFRGALQPRVGLVAASLLFGAVHFVPRRELLPWSLTALAAGLGLGLLFEATGNLVAPVVAHVVLNAANLRWLSRGGAGSALSP